MMALGRRTETAKKTPPKRGSVRAGAICRDPHAPERRTPLPCVGQPPRPASQNGEGLSYGAYGL